MANKFLTLAGLKAATTKDSRFSTTTIQFDALEKALKSYESIEEHEMNELRDGLNEVIKRANEAIKSKTAKSADRDVQKYLDNVLKAATTERKKIETDLVKEGMQKVEKLTIFLNGWKDKGEPMENRKVLIIFECQPKTKIEFKGIAGRGAVRFNNVELPPKGSIYVKAFASQGAADEAAGTLPKYDISKKQDVAFTATQGFTETKKIEADDAEQAARKLSLKGTAGVDFKLADWVTAKLGGEATHEETTTTTKKNEKREFQFTVPTGKLTVEMVK